MKTCDMWGDKHGTPTQGTIPGDRYLLNWIQVLYGDACLAHTKQKHILNLVAKIQEFLGSYVLGNVNFTCIMFKTAVAISWKERLQSTKVCSETEIQMEKLQM